MRMRLLVCHLLSASMACALHGEYSLAQEVRGEFGGATVFSQKPTYPLLAVSSDMQWVAMCMLEGAPNDNVNEHIFVRNLQSGAEVSRADHWKGAGAIHFMGAQVLAVRNHEGIVFKDVQLRNTFGEIRSKESKLPGRYSAPFAISQNEKTLAIENPDEQRLELYEWPAARLLRAIPLRNLHERSSQNIHDYIHGSILRFTPDGSRLVRSDTWGGVAAWNPVSGKRLFSHPLLGFIPETESNSVFSVVSPNATRLANTFPDAIRIFETTSGKLLREIARPDGAVSASVAFSPDTMHVAVQMKENDLAIDVISVNTGAVVGRLRVPNGTQPKIHDRKQDIDDTRIDTMQWRGGNILATTGRVLFHWKSVSVR